jgi:competence protein ComEC
MSRRGPGFRVGLRVGLGGGLLLLALSLLVGAAHAEPGRRRPAGASDRVAKRNPASLRVRFFSVGHGDAALLRTPSGHTVLIDAGRGEAQRLGDNFVVRRLIPFLKAEGIRRVDAFFISHPHWDHFGDPTSLARAVPITRIYSNDDGVAWLPELAKLAPLSALHRGQTLRYGKLSLEVLNPARRRHHRGSGVVATNNRSLVLLARYGERKLLFTGDLMFAGERALLRRRATRRKLRVDVLKLGHHGVYSSSDRWLRVVRPRWAIASCGDRWGQRWDYLSPKLYARLRKRRVRLLRTDRHGDVLVKTDGKRLEVSFERARRYIPPWSRARRRRRSRRGAAKLGR